jgi:hypothetical protein
MTLPEAGGKVATAAIEGLKTNPSCLAAILLAALFAILVYIGGQREGERAQRRLEITMDMLNTCVAKEPQR